LICPRKCVSRLRDLNEIESCDLWLTVSEVQGVIEDIYKCTCSVVVQDGAEAGQTVNHAHVHIIPKSKEEQKISASEKREPRGDQEMAEEAVKYRDFFEQSVFLQ